jgi:hypothetical protein
VLKGGGGDHSVGGAEGPPGHLAHAVESAHRTAIDWVTGKTRPANRCAKWRASDASRRTRRAASSVVANPDSISPTLPTLRNNVRISWAASQFCTLGSGPGRISSEGMLVSRRKPPFTTDPPAAQAMDCG